MTRVGLLVGLLLALLAPAATAYAADPAAPDRAPAADRAAEEALAARYAPVMMLVEQDEACGPGEPYQPSDVDPLFGNDSIALRGPWTDRDLVKIAPTAEDLGRGLTGYTLDLPPNPLSPGCDYEKLARRIWGPDAPATIYAHVATQAGYDDRLALQYFFYYPFNDFNNKHESDWEKIQLEFAAPDAAAALEVEPELVVYAQHYGSERAAWDDDKLERQDGTHPVVYVSAGSHASQFSAGLFLGRSADQGFGCDTTVGPHREVRPLVRTVPSDGEETAAAYPWIAFEGNWGERGPKRFYEAPTGPGRKQMWTRPFTFSSTARERSYPVPGAEASGTATAFFCTAVGTGSDVYRRFTDDPLPVLGVGALLLVAAGWSVRRTSWQTSAPFPLRRRRSTGEVLASGWSALLRRPLLFLGIGAAPFALAVCSAVLASPLTPGGTVVRVAGVVAGALELVALVLAQAATVQALADLDEGRTTGVLPALRAATSRAGPLLVTLALWAVLLLAMLLSGWLAPVALVCLVGGLLVVPVIQLDRRVLVVALRHSWRLARRQPLLLSVVVGLFALSASLLGGLIATLVLIRVQASFDVVNLLPALVPALLWPYFSLVLGYAWANGHERAAEADAAPAGPDPVPVTR